MDCRAEAEAGPVQAEEDSGAEMDYFDRQDLGKLRRRLRNAIESFQRGGELYLELVQDFLAAPPPPPFTLLRNIVSLKSLRLP